MNQQATPLHQLHAALAHAGLVVSSNIRDSDGHALATLVTDDSRRLAAGAVFVAVAGSKQDGHAFVEAAHKAGALAAICERPVDSLLPQIIVSSSREALGVLVGVMYRAPAAALGLVGITGTNGKTTTTYLVESILRAAAHNPGVIGTVNYRWNGVDHDAPYTTPTPDVLHQTLAAMRDAQCSHAIMEVSSAALSMERLAGIRFTVAAFSNLTQDHLDVHGSMEAYRDAKALLFTKHAAGGVAVINIDDEHGAFMTTAAAASGARVLRVSCTKATADIAVERYESTIAGISAHIRTPRGVLNVVSRPLLGRYNLANIALAVGIAEALGVAHPAIERGLAELAGVPGRVERVPNHAGLDILVDYAHTPDALENVLATLRPLASRRLLCVFGCGGDRDPTKRPKMGEVVARLADLAYVTSDNPRTEDPWAILEMVLGGIPSPHRVLVDRAAAIATAIAEATPGDIVLIAGKGHEDYQIIGTQKIHFDDREHAAAAVATRARYALPMIATAAQGQASGLTANTEFSRVHIDGRTAAAGDLYVAIRGEQHDGHDFCAQAVANGATGLMVDAAWATAQSAAVTAAAPTIIAVADTRVALGKIARAHAANWRGDLAAPHRRLVAITGSAGKTTTKDLVSHALASAATTHAAAGSLNNETGVPLTMLGLRAFHRFAVLEMGMRGAGQIAYLAELAKPDVAVVVNAGTAHMELLGSTEAILRAKCEIFGSLAAGGVAIWPADDARFAAMVREVAPSAKHRTFGEAAHADVRLVSLASRGAAGNELVLHVDGTEHRVTLRLVGRHNAINACAAVAAAMAAGVDVPTALAGLARARAPHMRGELRQLAGRNLLVDCYNANPAAMAAALQTLAELADGAPAVAVLGDMRELGDMATQAHHEVGRRAAALGVSLVAIGDHAADLLAGWEAGRTAGTSTAGAHMAATPEAAATRALALAATNQWILVKASRGMRLERVVDAMAALPLTT